MSFKHLPYATALAFLLVACHALPAPAQDLHEGFRSPPRSSRPLVWWHWMNGNITPEGLRKDILWMDRSGIAGFHIFDANFSTPQVVPERLEYMSAPWKEAYRSALSLADSLGMEVTIASSPGFSATGGPWVEPKDAMKKLVWRTVDVDGGEVALTLPPPFVESGPFANWGSKDRWSFYEDIAVLAVRLPDGFVDMASCGAEVSSSGGSFAPEQLNNGDLSDHAPIVADSTGVKWIQYTFSQPVRVKAVSFVAEYPRNMRHNMPLVCRDSLQVSDDGITFRTVAGLPTGSTRFETFDIVPVTARFFRFKLSKSRKTVSELQLHTVTRVDHAEGKAGFGGAFDLYDYPTPPAPPSDVVTEVRDITDCVKDGVLRWTAPEGRWRVFRFGASLTGKTNHPASPEATGLEVDKLSPEPWKKYFRNYLDLYKEASGDLFGRKGVRYILNDSYEAESETWTEILPEAFRSRTGYDLVPWLPALTGMIVSSSEETERFLWDWRMTLGGLFQENFSVMTDLLRDEYGLEGSYIESHANGRVYLFDGMSIKKTAAVPMSEMWVPELQSSIERIPEGITDIKESASVAHIYGQSIVAAESLTCEGLTGRAYSYHPGNLKRTADYELYAGVTRFVIHDSAHQPLDDKIPGLGLGAYGQWFHRHETWAEQAWVGTDYLSRSCFMLSQGKPVADVLWFYGEDNNATAFYSRRLPDVPDGFNYDYANPEVLYDEVFVEDSRVVSRSGMHYQVLVVDPLITRMSFKMLSRLYTLASQGAVICGGIPSQCASLMDDPSAFSRLRERLLALPNVHHGKSCRDILQEPDVRHAADRTILHVHRSLPDAEIYWVKNLSYDRFSTEVSFRTSGRIPQVWHPEDASVTEVSYRMEGGRTVVSLDFECDDAFFVVFSVPATRNAMTVPTPVREVLRTVDTPWQVSFQPGRKAPESIVLDKLVPLSEHAEKGVRYFSGTATYRASVKLPGSKRGKVLLDLGDVKNIATVYVNGHPCGTVWKSPFIVDVSQAVRKGENQVEVHVTNLWVNRLIGDCQEDEKDPLTYTPVSFYKADSPLLPSGLLGPVTFLRER